MKIGRADHGWALILDYCCIRATSAGVERFLANTAAEDGPDAETALLQDPGQAGKSLPPPSSAPWTATRSAPARRAATRSTWLFLSSAQAEAGNVFVLRAPWNETWLSSLEAFPTAAHDDDADASSRAFGGFHIGRMESAGFLVWAREELQRVSPIGRTLISSGITRHDILE